MALPTWKDRRIERENTYNVLNNKDGTITLIPVTGEIYEAGTPLNALNLNKINELLVLATTSRDGFMSKADKSKLNGIATNANNYSHPATHPASMITEDSTHRFLTDDERKIIQALVGHSTSGTSGYTKLSNGFILQWGDFTTAGINANSEITPQRVFPFAFPTSTLIVVPFVKKCITEQGAYLTSEVVIKTVTINSKSAFQIRIKAKEYVSGGVVVGYLAIGK